MRARQRPATILKPGWYAQIILAWHEATTPWWMQAGKESDAGPNR